MGSRHHAGPAVKVEGEGFLFPGGFGVEVHQEDMR
jgi:hypothetical protein